MGIVREETTHPYGVLELQVVERTGNEVRDPWKFASLRADSWQSLSPRELREVGRWLIEQGRRLGREYKSSGAPRKAD